VRVRILLDGTGSSTALDDSYVKALKEAGCSFAYYHAVRSWRIDRMNRRTHRRVLVVDGRIGFTGGVGFSDEWQGDADAPEHWREVHARLEGPIVGKLQAAFQEHWFKEVGETLSGKGEFPELPSAGNLRAQVVASHSFSTAPLSLVQAMKPSGARCRPFSKAILNGQSDTRSKISRIAHFGIDSRNGWCFHSTPKYNTTQVDLSLWPNWPIRIKTNVSFVVFVRTAPDSLTLTRL